jgi:large subunit ribosomal protein L17
MHRHGYKGRKFGRENDQRRALVRGLICALIEHTTITTTTARAKEIRRFTEKLVTRARKGGLANRRIVIAKLNNIALGNRLVDVIAPQIKRDSGYLRIVSAGYRKGDNSELSTISFVDKIEEPAITEVKPAVAKKSPAPATKPAVKKEAKS